MKKINFIAIFVLLTSIGAYAQQYNLTIKVKGLESTKGNISIGLYNNADNFPEVGKVYKDTDAKIDGKDFSYTFYNVAKGTYAVAIFHDENKNFKMDKNFFGIPTEAYGFSNDASGTFGAPDFEDASFKISNNKIITITLKY